jgi:hypothetical protein
MKLNWVNVTATILILGGIFLLFKRQQPPRQVAQPVKHVMTDEEIKQRCDAEVERRLGRPLNDIEKQMISFTRQDGGVRLTVVEPLRSRLLLAEQQRKATQPAAGVPAAPPSDGFQPSDMTMTPSPSTMPDGK